MKINNLLLISCFILTIFLISNVNSLDPRVDISDAGVEYEKTVLNKFEEVSNADPDENITDEDFFIKRDLNGAPLIKIIVTLKDESGIEVTGNKTERRNISKQKYVWLKNRVAEFVDSFGEDNVGEITYGVGSFTGYVTKETFDDLLGNSQVKNVKNSRGHYEPAMNEMLNIVGALSQKNILLFSVFIVLLVIMVFLFKNNSKLKK